MGTITKLNNVLCANISKVDNVLKANASKWDDNTFCPATPTPTPTLTPTNTPTLTPTRTPAGGVSPTPTPTMTPTPCTETCCYVELCYSDIDCADACQCNKAVGVYLHIPCYDGRTCRIEFADGIFRDDLCKTPHPPGYFSDTIDCYYWDGSTLYYQGPC